MAEATLWAARVMRTPGFSVGCWLLDEGNADDVKAMCDRVVVHHFSRLGIAEWNQPARFPQQPHQKRQLPRPAYVAVFRATGQARFQVQSLNAHDDRYLPVTNSWRGSVRNV